MDSFKKFLAEEEKPYDLLIISHDGIDDVNETGPLIHKTAQKMGIKSYLAETMGAFMENTKSGKLFHSYPVNDKGEAELPTTKVPVNYQKPFPMSPEKTLVMMRGLNPRASCESWKVMGRTLEHEGYKLINSVKCNEICNDKWHNHTIFLRENIQTPKTVLVRYSEGSLDAAKKLNNKYPMILKTSVGSIGVGVMYVESAKSLESIVQLLYREDRYIDILLQEYIKTEYDVRVIVVAGEIMGAMKRPIVKGDFRGNVSQGSKPEIHELTDLEMSESIRAAKAVEGDWVGVDFIPSQNRETEKPYFIEVNSNPGLTGIEEAFSKKFSMTEKLLKTYYNRENWKTQQGESNE